MGDDLRTRAIAAAANAAMAEPKIKAALPAFELGWITASMVDAVLAEVRVELSAIADEYDHEPHYYAGGVLLDAADRIALP